jgi:hypothetical protein
LPRPLDPAHQGPDNFRKGVQAGRT